MAISLRLDENLLRRLESFARQNGVTKSEQIRRCLDTALPAEPTTPSAWELGKHLFGRYSGPPDLSTHRKQIVREKIHAKHRRRRLRTVRGAIQRQGRASRKGA
jgi:hypothetical protein